MPSVRTERAEHRGVRVADGEVGTVLVVVDQRQVAEEITHAGHDEIPDVAGDDEHEGEPVRELVGLRHRRVLPERLVENEDEGMSSSVENTLPMGGAETAPGASRGAHRRENH